MKFHLTQSQNLMFTASGPGYVEINRERYEGGLIVLPDRVVTGWGAAGFAGLNAADFAQLVQYKPEIVVLGTGAKQQFPHPRLTVALAEARIGVEVMDTAAACRTFNILVGEDRRALAAILIEP
jgi:uncharacterized protein